MEEPRLLVDGAEAFPEIIRRIRASERSVYVNMFIWRDDAIGGALARELLRSAERGVRVGIVKDRYGALCEYAEEGQRSFFHPNLCPAERVSIWTLELLYGSDLLFRERTGQENALCRALRAHPNVTVSADKFRRDHSKFWVFDDEILILGGVNVEDKENGADRAGRRYRDYMVELRGADAVRRFWERREAAGPDADDLFAFNRKEPRRCFELKNRYLRLIGGAEHELTILMAYFAPDREITDAIRRAAARGAAVRLVMPARANFTDAGNKRVLRSLLGCPGVALHLTDRMLHAKLLMSEREITIGSCNISKKAFRQLDELNVFLPNDDGTFARAVRASVEETVALSHPVTDASALRYSRAVAALESLLM
ncbi:MAG: phosphatidylserine/phosphatidylglycerophosphate/cardiolipin synthase family protein [Ruminococcaceae bacterium]|nr:phosphatidylserine/phosphatidylglycerophosphate/cardiolipin synthase family protein [Oscillospiraceae bacterium]